MPDILVLHSSQRGAVRCITQRIAPSHLSGTSSSSLFSDTESHLVFAQGNRLAILVQKLSRP